MAAEPPDAEAPRGARTKRRPSGNPPAEPSAFFGRRKGKALRQQQAELVETLLPTLRVDTSRPVDPARLFRRPVADLWLEIGFGGGEHLLAQAAGRPDVGFLGCEPFVNGMAKLLHGIADADLDNIRLHPDEAASLLDTLPDRCLGRVDLLYPDPWPKRRQRKRRFMSMQSLGRMARVMRPGAALRFATDIDDYAGWTLARMLRCPAFAWTAASARDWTEPWPGWTPTRYEQKAMSEGRSSVYLTFLRR
jgi:tRNA (guanine-N7-)-methyltransferase